MPRWLFDFQLPESMPRLAKNSFALRLKSRHSATVTFGVARSCAVLGSSFSLYLIIVEIQNLLVHVSAVKCPKCDHFQDFSSLGDCETCERSDWAIGGSGELFAKNSNPSIVCLHCDRGFKEVPCEKCGATILGSWLNKQESPRIRGFASCSS